MQIAGNPKSQMPEQLWSEALDALRYSVTPPAPGSPDVQFGALAPDIRSTQQGWGRRVGRADGRGPALDIWNNRS